MPDLSVLVKRRQDVLLAVIAAWLHDWPKCEDNFISQQWEKSLLVPEEKIQEFRKFTKRYKTEKFQKDFGSLGEVTLCGVSESIVSLAKQGRHPRKALSSPSPLVRLLGWAHGQAHFGKELKDREAEELSSDWLATPLGYEVEIVDSLSRRLVGDVRRSLKSSREERLKNLQAAFTKAPGDTRRPINEVTLWNWAVTVSALFKAELARCILLEPRDPEKVRWRLLSIRTDGLEYLLSAPAIPDLLARKDLLADAWNRAQKVLEEEYPLGLEVYRDENGPVYVVPDLENLLGLGNPADNHKTLREYILEAFRAGTVKENPSLALNGELVPVFKLDEEPWKGQPAHEELPPIHEHLSQQPPFQSDAVALAYPWRRHNNEEVCATCGFRPQGPSLKAKQRKVCDVCEQRRNDRAERWVKQSFGATIWLGEVADQHNRIALLVGTFDLSRWLEGTLVHSLAARDPSKCGVGNKKCPQKSWKYVSKNPSFARLRRIWETTRKFWQEVAPTDEDNKLADSEAGRAISKESTQRKRLQIKGNLQPVRRGDTPGPYHAYELELPRGVRLSVVWDPKNERFITADNLDYLEGKTQLGQPLKNVLRKGSVFRVLEPIGYGASDKVWGEITLSEDASDIPASEYTPLIPILAEPRTFMALVPADKAVDVVQAIRTKYEREMGKVRNRLPLHLGVVFADAHTPLRAILDAGRRMLKQKAIGKVGKWEIAEDVTEQSGALLAKAADLAQGTQQFDKWYAVKLKHGGTGRALTWYVPAVMGDGSTEDNWYPYVFLAREDEPADRNRYFSAPNPWNAAHKWLVHAGELEPGDKVYFTPATLDFQWLDSSASRFEIAYDGESGQRKGNLSRRPYLLDELDTLERIWKTLSEHSTTSQIHALVSLIESRREDWGASPQDDTFRAVCRDALANAEWKSPPWPSKDKKDQWLSEWAEHAARGWITDAVEIWMKIMKEKPVADKIQGGNA